MDKRLYSLIIANKNVFNHDCVEFNKSIYRAFSNEKVFASCLIELYDIGIVKMIENAVELNQDLMDSVMDILKKRETDDELDNEYVYKRAVNMWFQAYGEEVLGLYYPSKKAETNCDMLYEQKKHILLGLTIDKLGLSDALIGKLHCCEVFIVKDLCSMTLNEIRQYGSVDQTALTEMESALIKHNLHLLPEGVGREYWYPDSVKKIIKEKDAYWGCRLFIETVIVGYEWISNYRNQKKEIHIGDNSIEIKNDIQLFTWAAAEMQVFKIHVDSLTSCVEEDVKAAILKPDELADSDNIIDSAEKFMYLYEKVISWKLSYQNVNCDTKYKGIVEQFCDVAEQLCKFIDCFYNKALIAKKTFNDWREGFIPDADLHIDLCVSCKFNSDNLTKEIDEYKKTIQCDSETEMNENKAINEYTIKIEKLDFSPQIIELLKESKIETLGELADKTEEEIKDLFLGNSKAILEMEEVLSRYCLEFKKSVLGEMTKEKYMQLPPLKKCPFCKVKMGIFQSTIINGIVIRYRRCRECGAQFFTEFNYNYLEERSQELNSNCFKYKGDVVCNKSKTILISHQAQSLYNPKEIKSAKEKTKLQNKPSEKKALR